jgi:transposase
VERISCCFKISYFKAEALSGWSVMSRIMSWFIHSHRFKKAEGLANFIGVIPRLTESGVFWWRSCLSKKGLGLVIEKLYMAAIVAGQYDITYDQKKRLLDNGKIKMQSLGAAMRKLAHPCCGVIKNQAECSPQVMI